MKSLCLFISAKITGIANRTTIADGNTWNHEHIATLGRCLTAPVRDAHKIARHLADYVLLWTGGGGDDLAKSPHMARIGNSVYVKVSACVSHGLTAYNDNVPPKLKTLPLSLFLRVGTLTSARAIPRADLSASSMAPTNPPP